MWIALVCVGVLALCVLAGCYWIYTVAFMSHPKYRNDPYYLPNGFDPGTDRETFNKWVKAVDDIPYEAVYITSRDGLKLKARYYGHRLIISCFFCFYVATISTSTIQER